MDGPVRGEAPPASDIPEGRRFDRRLQSVGERATEVERQRLGRVSLADLAGK